jgi:dehydrogenase/reductase SDR family member 12
VSALGRVTDALLEASVVGSFSRIGIEVRSRLLPEFTGDGRDPGGGDPGHGRDPGGGGASPAGRVAVITGATSGLGLAAARALAARGWTVHFLARDPDRAERARAQIAAAGADGKITYGLADMEDLDSLRAFASDFRSLHSGPDVLVHAAGAIHKRHELSQAGFERTFGGQVIAPFALTKLLMHPLMAAAPARVITVASGGMYTQRLGPSTVEMRPSGYNGVTAYARAKRAQVALSAEWARRVDPAAVAFHAMHPGWADTPGLAASLPRFHRLARPILRSPDEGADTIVWLATAAAERLGSGCLWLDRRPRLEYWPPWTREHDPAIARHLWDRIDATTR